ncbi:MAG: DEAD/DEAH box helicase [Sphingobacteriales bacterium]|nr:MAG: DEAD/DEAH box helicase [Sphingobacteriales bacterium]
MQSFKDLPLREELLRAIEDLGFETPTAIQQQTIPLLLQEPQDLVGLAQTGTGKTAAFGFPLLHHVDVEYPNVQALVLSPTRELCMQIEAEFQKYGKYIKGLRTTAVYGGVPITGQIRALKSGAQVVVATPGRLIDLLERKAINLSGVEYVVLDEADEMLNMGFREDIDLILQSTPSRQYTWLFSATMNNDVRGIAKRFMNEWKEVRVAAANTTNENIDHQYYITNHHNRFPTLQRLLDHTPGIYGIIFVRTRQDCQDIADNLMKAGYHVSPLHGDMDQKARSKVMDRFKTRQLQALVATDVAARGIDVNDITHVINYELPDDPEIYTHRSGRTARAGKSGICMSIVSPREVSQIRNIERIVKSRFIRSDIPDGAEVIRKRLFHFLDEIATTEPQEGFGEAYQGLIHERFDEMDKDELIRRLVWLRLKETIAAYDEADDLNAGYESTGGQRTSGGGKSQRLFMNLGTKDGLNNQKLISFVTEGTDVDPELIDRVTVRELSSYFNIRTDAAEFIMDAMNNKQFKGRKVRVDLAQPMDNSRARTGGKPSGSRGGYGGGGGDRYEKKSSYGGERKSYGDRSRDFSHKKDRNRD